MNDVSALPATNCYDNSDGDDEDDSCCRGANDEGKLLLESGVIFLCDDTYQRDKSHVQLGQKLDK